MIERLDVPVALERQHAAAPGDAAPFTDEPDLGLAPPRGPREKHRSHAVLILEHQLRGILDVVARVPQAAGPGVHRLRRSRDVQQLVDQVRAMIEQHAASAIRAPPAPRHGTVPRARIGGESVDAELGEMPAADGAVIQPPFHAPPHRVETVLMAGHDDPARVVRGGRQRRRLRAIYRDRFLAQDVIALRQTPQRHLEVRRRRRADIDEVDLSEIGKPVGVG